MECNKSKSSLAPQSANDVVLHPYFDNITNVSWLVAKVLEQSPCVLTFDVKVAATWDAMTAARVKSQFKMLELARLYSSQAARETSDIQHNLAMHLASSGAQGVQSELMRQWKSRRANRLNSWQTAMYYAIAHNDWFCSGGFQ
jgi:hypothetical protein